MSPFTNTAHPLVASAARVAWHEGMQLLPQHFQLADERIDALVRHLAMASVSPAWGIEHLSLDLPAIAGGTLRVREVSGSFPDGCAFFWSQERYGPLERQLDAPQGAGRQTYALALPLSDFRDQESIVPRHRQHMGEPVSDAFDADSKAAISRWIPNLSLRRWDRFDGRFLQLPLVVIEYGAAGPRLLDFHPPCTRLLADGAAARGLAQLVHLLRAKAMELGAAPRANTLAGSYSGPTLPVLQSLLAQLPRLEAMLQARAHPHQVFLTLCDLSGALAWMHPDELPTTPEYDHTDPAAAVLELIQRCATRTQGIVVKPAALWHAHALRQQDGRWLGQLPSHAGATLVLRVQLSGGATREQGAAWLERALICRDDEEHRCRNLRVRGYGRELVEQVEELGLSASSSQLLMKVSVPAPPQQPWTLVVGVPQDQRDGRIGAIDYLKPQ